MTQILVVDDDRAARIALSKRLSVLGYEVLEASSGQRAIEQFEQYRPRVILLDASMPDVSGFDVCRHVREVDPDRSTKVLFLSGVSTPSREYVAQCAKAHDADGYLRKPYDFNELLDFVNDASTPPGFVEVCS